MAPDAVGIVKDGSRPDALLSRVLGVVLDAAVIVGALVYG